LAIGPEKDLWEQAINEVGDKMLASARLPGRTPCTGWLAKFTNEAAYLMRKFGALWGTNSSTTQARICHSHGARASPILGLRRADEFL
jgi:anaerobic selenocysteine-containing dehydrogenase